MAANQVTVSTPGPAGAIGMTYEGLWTVDDVYQVRDCVRYTNGNLYFCNVQHTAATSNNPLVNTTYWSLFINADDAFQWATKAKHTQITDSLGNTGYSALHQAGKAQDWASLTTDAVTNDANASDVGYSAKAWAIGGTEVTTTASRGAAKEWATSTGGAVDTSEFSAKAYAIGGTGVTDTAGKGAAKEWAIETSGNVDGTSFSAKEYAQGTQASTGGSAKDYAQKTDGGVSGATSDHSAKAWAVGGTGVTDTSSKGAAKEWAIETSGNVDGTSFSAKEYAQGTQASTGGSAKDYAQKTNGGVSGATSDHSAKAWAVGGTGVTDTASKGAAKEWAIETSGNVDGTSFSAKEYAQGTQASTGGSAKDYAQKVDGGVSGATSDHSAKAWAVGGTGVTTTSAKGAAKEWATTTGGAVDTSEFSSKEYAIGTTASTGGSAKDWAIYTAGDVRGGSSGDMSAKEWAVGVQGRGVAGEGSAKDWATRAEDSTVDNSGYSALHHAAKAAASATAAAASETAANASIDAASVIYDAIHDKYLGEMADSASQGTNPTTNGTWAKNSSSITVASASNIKVGQVVTGTGIPTSPKPNVISIDGTTVVISDNMAAAGSSVSLTFTGYGIYGDFNGTKDGPALNNDGDALTDGVKYFNTTDDVMMVYDATTSAWKRTQPTTTEQGHINTVSGIAANVTTVAGISANVTTVAGISANVTTVAGISANVTTVAGISANVTTVAGIHANVTTVAGVSANVTTVATNIADVNNFADLYQIDDFSPSAPATDGGGNSLAEGDLAYDSTANRLKYYNGSSWEVIGLTTAETQTEANNAAVAMAIALG